MKRSRHPRPDDEDLEDIRKSKSQEKRESHALQAAGERLVDVADTRLAAMNLPAELMETIRFARTCGATMAPTAGRSSTSAPSCAPSTRIGY